MHTCTQRTHTFTPRAHMCTYSKHTHARHTLVHTAYTHMHTTHLYTHHIHTCMPHTCTYSISHMHATHALWGNQTGREEEAQARGSVWSQGSAPWCLGRGLGQGWCRNMVVSRLSFFVSFLVLVNHLLTTEGSLFGMQNVRRMNTSVHSSGDNLSIQSSVPRTPF